MSKKVLLPCLALCLLAFGLACDSASPVAPTGTVLSISASPSEISSNGTSTIRVTALRANGTPVNPGTVIRLSTTIGTIDETAETDDQGTARAILRGNGDLGTATVTAQTGSVEAVTVEVRVGDTASSVTLQATPSQVDDTGGTVDLLAVVRDSDGEPLQGATVNFGTEVGTLGNRGSIDRTNENGEATDTLTLEAEDLQALTANSFTVTVTVGAGESTQSDTATIRINECVTAAFRATPQDNYMLVVENQSTGQGDLTFEWNFGPGANPATSTQRNPPTIDYEGNGGQKDISLTVRADCGEETEIVSVFIDDDVSG